MTFTQNEVIPSIYMIHKFEICRMLGGKYEVWNYLYTVDFIANYHFTGDVFYEITNFCLRDVVYSRNTEQNLLKLPYNRPKNR